MHFHVFLSHSSTHKPAVEELARRLAKEGIQAWLDKCGCFRQEEFYMVTPASCYSSTHQ
jgi:hypothetical protein